MKFVELYADYLIRITGGQFLWSEFKRKPVEVYLLVINLMAIFGIVLDMFLGGIFKLVIFLGAFGSLAIIGVVGLLSENFQKIILVPSPDLRKAKYGLYFIIYTGVGGCLIILL